MKDGESDYDWKTPRFKNVVQCIETMEIESMVVLSFNFLDMFEMMSFVGQL